MLGNRLSSERQRVENQIWESQMTLGALNGETLGWIGVGRMGEVLAGRLLDQGCDLSVYNRTSAKAKALIDRGAKLVEYPVDLAGPANYLPPPTGGGGGPG